MPSRWRSGWIAALLATALVAVPTGCAGIPSSGPVIIGQDIDEQDSGDFEFFPARPMAGASQEEILRGFVAAFTGSADNFGVARSFLSIDFADDWNPRSTVTVRSSTEQFLPAGENTMEYSINAAAVVDSTGAYRQNNSPQPLTLQFAFVQENDEWRISAASDGIVLSDATFRSIYGKHALYFLDPTGTRLVPDLRWFPGGTTARLRVVSALLDGPPPWLRGAVRTAFPDGTQLEAPSVEVESGVATVDLSTEALTASVSERQLMQLQLTASLENIASIREVSISVSGSPLSIPELAFSPPQANPLVDARAVVFKDGGFGYLARDNIATLGELSDKVVETGPRGATIADSVDTVAVLGASGVSIVRDGDVPTVLLDARADLITPSLDNDGYVWSASRSDPSSLRVIDYSGAAVDIPTGLPADARIASIDVSRDGARIAILLATSTGPRLIVTAINRNPTGDRAPVGLSEAILDANSQAGEAIDATWVDNLSIATLAVTGSQGSVTLHEVGGERTSLGLLDAATSLVGGNGEAGLRAVGASGTVLARSGIGWTDLGIVVSFIATQR